MIRARESLNREIKIQGGRARMVKLELASIMAIRSLLPRVFVESYGLQFR